MTPKERADLMEDAEGLSLTWLDFAVGLGTDAAEALKYLKLFAEEDDEDPARMEPIRTAGDALVLAGTNQRWHAPGCTFVTNSAHEMFLRVRGVCAAGLGDGLGAGEVAGFLDRLGITTSFVDALRAGMVRERANLCAEVAHDRADQLPPEGTLFAEADVPAAYRLDGTARGQVLTRPFLKGFPMDLSGSNQSKARIDERPLHHIRVKPADGGRLVMAHLWVEIRSIRRQKTEREADRHPAQPEK
jgi:hypothetical protein